MRSSDLTEGSFLTRFSPKHSVIFFLNLGLDLLLFETGFRITQAGLKLTS